MRGNGRWKKNKNIIGYGDQFLGDLGLSDYLISDPTRNGTWKIGGAYHLPKREYAHRLDWSLESGSPLFFPPLPLPRYFGSF